ncbi:MAG: TlpA family protein disulfide reductase [Oleispira antarctica]|uniref:Thioredoxin family protein n=1 Tax=Oleispira antarctica RB-8 TaxID=698738 RepID=R4YKV5_OLEAN|nr:TlpA family protein disulfide reductase [Oleispira antarctica]MBQ0792197.1 TlpA family protein disulfide reductase [Oleispira antarctica]CCK75271.1 Thioredoxin family protein [Oleispira antarctica RB-8]
MKSLFQRLLILFLIPMGSSSVWADEPLDLSQYKGKQAVYIDFWASWCGPCRQSFPWLNQMNSRYAEQGLKVIAVNVDSDRDDAIEFLAEHPSNFQVIYDPKGVLAERFGIQGMPSAVLISREGEVVSQHIGFKQDRAEHYEQSIKQLLAEGEQGE